MKRFTVKTGKLGMYIHDRLNDVDLTLKEVETYLNTFEKVESLFRSKEKKDKKKTTKKPKLHGLREYEASEDLMKIVKTKTATRPYFVTLLWSYIRTNKLQDKNNKRMIHADEKLRPIFKKDVVSMFELADLVNKHLTEVKK